MLTTSGAPATPLTKAQVAAKTTTDPAPAAVLTLTEDIYETFGQEGEAEFGSRRRIWRPAGAKVTQTELDAMFAAGTVTNVSPSAGLAAAGGTTVTVTGTRLGGTTGVTVGGTAGTAVKVLSETKLKFVTPAKTAGAHALVVQNDDGNIAGGNLTFV